MSDIKVMCASVLKHSLVHLGVWRPVLWDRSWCCLTGALTLVFPLITYSMGVKKSLMLHELQNMPLNAYYLVLLFLWLLWSVQCDTMVTPAEFFALLLSIIGSTYNTKHPDLIFSCQHIWKEISWSFLSLRVRWFLHLSDTSNDR